MSLKNMAVKMALALAAAKGAEAFSKSGGMEGIKRKLAQNNSGGGGSLGSGSGGLGGLIAQLGMGSGATAGGNSNSLGGLLGGLAGASGGAPAATKMKGLLDTTAETPENTQEEEEVSGLMMRAMIQAARADGEIDAGERRVLTEIVGDATPEERAFFDTQMSAPIDPESLARDTPKGHEIEVYTAAVLAIEPDNRAEAQFLDKLARGLGLPQAQVNEIHSAHDKPPLYTL